MTPAIDIARKSRISFKVHEYSHDPASESYGDEAAEKLAVPQEQVFKTLVVSLDGKELAVGIIPVSSRLSLKLIAKALGAKKAAMAVQSDVERVTGYVLGGVSPLGQKKRLRTIIDTSATYNPTVFISAGRRGLDMELAPEDLKALVSGEFVKIT
ncbi:Cys-tRNA(Pro) deacylase [Idiomarina sp. Sol25]|uniref:Cys-tRNA(Pro) deacylase n=1 Tax=Idiomarina TaxID=135575 RepID=UPI00294AA2CF|nr:Cys-tRNA(Pro) deacylase [Idiomarina sp. Sol25]MDV6328923.1 Cys-tRNA(Pro) deacylase [Idiomarina sp. Sol25]